MAVAKKVVVTGGAVVAAAIGTFALLTTPPDEATFSWNPVTQNTDGSAVATPVNYAIYRKQGTGIVRVCITNALKCKVIKQPSGTQTFYVTAIDKLNSESEPSVTIEKTFKPKGPTNVGLDPPTDSGVD